MKRDPRRNVFKGKGLIVQVRATPRKRSLPARVERRLVRRRLVVAALIAIGLLVGVILLAPSTQPSWYHDFADTSPLLGVPNGLNVLSNAAFLLVGVAGLLFLRSPRAARAFLEPWEQRNYVVFFGAIALTAFGSAYYHSSPSDARLFWDRLPMTVAFTSLAAIVFIERVHSEMGRRLVAPLLAFGIAAILIWRLTGELRPYIFLEVSSLSAVVLLSKSFPSRYPNGLMMAGVVACYGVAVLCETLDKQIKEVLGVTGGHPLKHLAAAAGAAYILWMLRRRSGPREA